MSYKSLLLPALAVLSLTTAPSFAEDAESRTLVIDRAELLTEAGATRTYGQIRTVALEACRAENRGGVDFARTVQICVADTVERTVESLNAPLLTALHNRKPREIRLASIG